VASVLQAASVATPARSGDEPVPLNPGSAAPRELRRAPRRQPRLQQQQHESTGGAAAGEPRGQSDTLLTAEELAAAFQLDFKPAAAAARARQQGGGPPRRRRVPIGKLIAALLLLGIGGAAVALVVMPDVRADALNWAQDTYATLREKVDGNARPPAPPAGRTTTAAQGSSSESTAVSAPAPAARDVMAARSGSGAGSPAPGNDPAGKSVQQQQSQQAKQTQSKAPEPPSPAQSQQQQQAAAAAAAIPPTVVTPPPPVLTPKPAEMKAPEPDPVRDAVNRPADPIAAAPNRQDLPPLPKADPPKPQPPQAEANKPPAAAKPMDPDVAYDRAIVLWRQALDAEQAGNYAEAVRTYEELQKLPKDVWPAPLEINLKLARRRLGREG
jgi:hypothetical protein